MIIYIVYKTINLINKKYYIGVHQQYDEVFDGYYGSGLALNRAIKKYGEQNFIRETLFTFNNSVDAFLKEKELVTPEIVKSKNNYNICEGGIGGVGGFLSFEQRSINGKKIAEINRKNKQGPWFNEKEHKKACSKGGSIGGKLNAKKEGFLSWVNSHRTYNIKYKHITNEIISKMIKKDDEIPIGFRLGRLFKTSSGKKWYTNGKENKVLGNEQKIPDGFYIGKTKGKVPVFNKTTKNTLWYNNNIKNIRILSSDPIPEHFKRGRIKWKV